MGLIRQKRRDFLFQVFGAFDFGKEDAVADGGVAFFALVAEAYVFYFYEGIASLGGVYAKGDR